MFILELDKKLDQFDQVRRSVKIIFLDNSQTGVVDDHHGTLSLQRHVTWRIGVEMIGLSVGQIAKIYGVERSSVWRAIDRLRVNCANDKVALRFFNAVRNKLTNQLH